MTAILTCLNFRELYCVWVRNIVRFRRAPDGIEVASGIFNKGLGLLCLTGIRTVQLFTDHPSGACPDHMSSFFWVEMGYAWITIGNLQHSIGKANSDKNIYLGWIGCIAAVTASVLITLYAMHEHLCG